MVYKVRMCVVQPIHLHVVGEEDVGPLDVSVDNLILVQTRDGLQIFFLNNAKIQVPPTIPLSVIANSRFRKNITVR
jgi:hypothetical protein